MVVLRNRRRLVAVAGATAALLGAPAADGRLSAPQGTSDYLRYARTYMLDGAAADSARDRTWAEGHEALVLAEGQRSCDWLEQQRAAPAVDRTGDSTTDAVKRRYLATRSAEGLALSFLGRGTVVGGAWEYLCPSTRDSRTAPAGRRDD